MTDQELQKVCLDLIGNFSPETIRHNPKRVIDGIVRVLFSRFGSDIRYVDQQFVDFFCSKLRERVRAHSNAKPFYTDALVF